VKACDVPCREFISVRLAPISGSRVFAAFPGKYAALRYIYVNAKTQTFSPPGFGPKKAVNNSGDGNAESIDFIGLLVLPARFMPAFSGEQTVHINSLSNWRFTL
jgi:hypothetical protein